MLLYLTSNQKSGLIDGAAHEMLMLSKKSVGKLSLKSLVTKDMGNYITVKFLPIDTAHIEGSGEDLTLALRSFQIMPSTHIIVILFDCEDISDRIQRLLSIEVVNLITAEALEDAGDELRKALSDEGTQRHVTPAPVPSQPEFRWEPTPEPEAEIIPHRWSAKNTHITVAGVQRRNDVAVATFNLVAWPAARGAEATYIEVNTNRRLQLLLSVYEAAPTSEHCTTDGTDCYLTSELDREYQFIIYDHGVIQTPTSVFREADCRLLRGSVLPYEIPAFHKTLKVYGGLEVCPVAISVSGEFRKYCRRLFDSEMRMAETSHNLLIERANWRLYKCLVEPYIMGERRL